MDNPAQGEPIGEKWHATLRGPVASQTATACRGRFRHLGRVVGEGA
ncbi:DUF6380 family protein [Streptomyces phyllanthi]